MLKSTMKKIIMSLVFLLIINSFLIPAVYEKQRVQASSIEKEEVYAGLGIMFLMVVLSGRSGDDKSSDQIKRDDYSNYENFDAEEMEMLASIIHAEARGESYKGKVAVGAVILNRVYHPSFPDNIKDVIYQSGQFTPVEDGSINITPDDASIRAAYDAARGIDPSKGSLYFYNPKKSQNPDFFAKRTKVVEINDHVFLK
ncbi:MAG: cell wall hydrolase [Halanaerobium sp.]